MAKITGLSESQVYKWCWDQKKKIKANDKNTTLKKALVFKDPSGNKISRNDYRMF